MPATAIGLLAPPRTAVPVAGARPSVFLPKEHGSWSFALEPLAFGLLVAPSLAGGAFAVAVVAGFFLRRPLKNATAAGPMARRSAAIQAAAMFAVFAVVALAEAVALGGMRPLAVLVLAVPCGVLFAVRDRRNDSRSLPAEISGTVAFAVVPAAVALFAGWPVAAALALALLALARSVPTLLAVRTYLRHDGRAPVNPLAPLVAAGLAVMAAAGLVALELAPLPAVVAALVLLGRTIWLLGPVRPGWPARRVGMLEAGLGMVYVGLIAAAF